MGIDYDNDPRYTKINDGEYEDTETGDTIIIIEDELVGTLKNMFDIPEDVDEIKLTQEMLDVLLEGWNK